MRLREGICTQEAARVAATAGVPVWFEPVSVPKAARAAGTLHLLEYISPNAAELIAISEALGPGRSSLPQHGSEHASAELDSETAGSRRLWELRHHIKRVLDAGSRYIVLTLGVDGAALCTLRCMIPFSSLCLFYPSPSVCCCGMLTGPWCASSQAWSMLQFTWRQHRGGVYACTAS